MNKLMRKKEKEKVKKQNTQNATLAAGCFWHVQEAFREIKGVLSTTVGYIGGSMKNPSYEAVCSLETGHAEAVEIIFEPKIISYSQILDIFWSIHDPTQINRQGPDFGTQYRSAIFYHTQEQRKEAFASKEKEQKKYQNEQGKNKCIATQIVPATPFYKAEEYHQKYLHKKGLKVCGVKI